METKTTFRSGYVAIVGKPNVGKSTLMNALLGEKLSAVTPKPQTTRHQILGILSSENYQIVFLDTPGFLEPKYKLQEMMLRSAYRALQDADLIVLMVEPFKEPEPFDLKVLNKLKEVNKPVLLAINKVDLLQDKRPLLPLIDTYNNLYQFVDIIPISALKQDGLEVLLDHIVNSLPEGTPFYPPDQLTAQPERFFVSELIREKIFELYGEEIPYFSAVLIEEFKERDRGKDYIKAVIYVDKDSQKAILIGKGGEKLKKVGQMARKDIEAFLGRPVYLELWVRVRKGWRENLKDLRDLGYT